MTRTISVLLALTLILFVAAGAVMAQETVKIGLFAPITGAGAADGFSATESAKLAVDMINEAGGVRGLPVELVIYDDRGDAREAVAIANRLIQRDGVLGVVSGSYTPPTRAAAPIYQEAGVPMISAYAVQPEITLVGDYIFRNSFLGTVQGRAGAWAAANLLGAKRVSLLVVDNDFGVSLASAFEEYGRQLGLEIISHDRYPYGETEFRAILTRIRQLRPDLIYMVAYYAEGANILRQAQQLRLDIPFLGGEGVDSFQFLELAGDAAEGLVITTNLDRDSERPLVQEYLRRFQERTGHVADMVGASTFDAVRLLANAIEVGGFDHKAIRDALAATQNFEGVTGLIERFDERGEVIKPVLLQQVRDGGFHFYAIIEDRDIVLNP